MKRILYFLTLILLFSCKENNKNNQQFVFNQPDFITIDTSKAYFTFVKKYILENKKSKNKTNYFIMSLYDNNDDGLRIKFLATKGHNAFNGRIPYHYFRYKEDTILVFTGLDMVTKTDSIYTKKIDNFFRDKSVIIYDPPCWEIFFNNDTCYYKQTTYPFVPLIPDGPKFTGPPY